MEVKYWTTASERPAVFEFIESQPPDAAQRLMKSVEHLAEQGMNLLMVPSRAKHLRGYADLYELKVDYKGIFYRIIFCVKHGIAYLLLAFKKKTNSTPMKHIRTALSRQQAVVAC
jgi:phage-related protein